MFAYGNSNLQTGEKEQYALSLLKKQEKLKNDIENEANERKKQELERQRQTVINQLRQIKDGQS